MGDLPAFIQLVYAFLIEKTLDVTPVIELYVQGLAQASPGLDVEATKALLYGRLASFEDKLAPFDEASLVELVGFAPQLGLDGFLGILAGGLFDGVLGDIPEASGSLHADPVELARLMGHPVGADPAMLFGLYEQHLADLGAAILDDPGWFPWPWYQAKTLVSGVLASLAFENPRWAHRPELVVFDAGFTGPGGEPLATLDPASPPATVTAWAEVFLALGPPEQVHLAVVSNPPGVDLTLPTLIAEVAGEATAGPGRLRLEVSFAPMPAAAGATALGLELRAGNDEKPCIISDFDQYAAFGHAPTFREPYTSRYGAFPPSLAVAHPAPLAPTGSVRGHATAAGRAGLPAQVTLDQAPDASAADAGPSAAFLFEPLAPGLHTVYAALTGYEPGQAAVEVAAGDVAVLEVSLEPVPLVEVAAACCPPTNAETRWTANAEGLPVVVSVTHFPDAPELVEVAAGSVEGPASTWLQAPDSGLVPLDGPIADGQALVAWARADGGTPARSGVVRVDTSPPAPPALELAGDPCGLLAVTATGSDEHSPVVAAQVRAAGDAWHDASPPSAVVTLDVTDRSRPVVVEARVMNAAGLWSENATAEACAASPHPDPADVGGPPTRAPLRTT